MSLKMRGVITVVLCFFLTNICIAGEKFIHFKASPELNKETIAKAKATAKNLPTKELIESKVKQACKLMEKEGSAAFPKFNGKDSEFIFAGTYIWIHDLQGKMRMHPIKPKMASGKSLLFLKDKKGNKLFVGMNKIAREKGEGWYEYVWPKPGEKAVSPKVSFIKLVTTADGEQLIVGCGAYGDKLVKSIRASY
jgi:cytochrome c